ncbi:hypothetical protein AUK40_03765 [Candidatus Wirthbacteria bacterium CG2_30_54_11]|uniref:Addiction module antitoxin n=1 Tax=Candidatus Wirthbacteria bacterium CG2_30_54_11 TaxID=1817892 RepID=A0A1J5IKD0_9BACT|nr:MAG: hypothetical protein AUK40_03765 [Candidatus Wirthbacteria bacterium CG2_30_54_11]
MFKKSVAKDLKKLPKAVAEGILRVIHDTLPTSPQAGEPLKGSYRGLWRLRVGRYRVVYEIHASEIVILILRISHRKDVYRGLL